MLNGPDWNKLYANGQCLYFGVPFSDEQWKALDNAANESDRNDLVRKFREEYLKDRDVVTGEIKKTAPKIEEAPAEEIEEVEEIKPVKKIKKGK